MPDWLTALATPAHPGAPAILVTVAATRGSTPRAASARMVITADNQFDTIGGGHLEWRAIEMARAMLAASGDQAMPYFMPQCHRIVLGPSLGQCCGGAVQLVFEIIDTDAAEAAAMISALVDASHRGRDVWRVVPLQPGQASRPYLIDATSAAASALTATGTHLVRSDADAGAAKQTLYDLCLGQRPQVNLFGAGHVGRALVHILGSLNCAVTWIDQRDNVFPAQVPHNTSVEVSDTPEAVVQQAAPGSYFLVMTHSHAMDQALSEQILRRNDAAWFGLIGSATKRAQFVSRLSQRGFSDAQIVGMTCPIGIAGIRGKEPASIALAVAAQLLQLWEQAGLRQQS
jgi:xanthine dehydrogenase accessory factor